MALTPLKAGGLKEGLKGRGVDGGGSKGTEAASRGAEWWLGRPEVAESGGGAARLRQSQGKAMTGGSTCQPGVERGEGSAR
jgi:hypothetical protein